MAHIIVDAVELDPGTAAHHCPDLARVLAYWNRRRGERFAPRRGDIEPADLIEVLPRVMLADVEGNPPRFRYRLSGTAIVEVHGKEMTGLTPHDLEPRQYGELVHAHYSQCARRRAPLFHLVMLETMARSRSYVRLLMPLSEDGRNVTMLFSVDSAEQNTAALRERFRRMSSGQVSRRSDSEGDRLSTSENSCCGGSPLIAT